jgi:hypothetical protein
MKEKKREKEFLIEKKRGKRKEKSRNALTKNEICGKM